MTNDICVIWGQGETSHDVLRNDDSHTVQVWCDDARDDLSPGWRDVDGWTDAEMPQDAWIIACVDSDELNVAIQRDRAVRGYLRLGAVPASPAAGWIEAALVARDNAEAQ